MTGMPRTMFDSIAPAAIPADADLALGYRGGSWPTFDDGSLRARCPKATLISVAVHPDLDADGLDVERYDADPSDAPGWLTRQRSRGHWVRPFLYCDVSTWPTVEQMVSHLPRPDYVIACYDDDPTIPQEWVERGCVAKQYRSDEAADLDYSVVVDDTWFPTTSLTMTPEVAVAKFGLTHIAFLPEVLKDPKGDHEGRLPFYGTRPDGSVYAFNGAKPVPGLNARNIVRDDVIGLACIADGDIVLACDDGAPDPEDSDGWAASTYHLLATS